MNLRDEILKEHSKRQTDKIIRYVGADQKKFDALVELFLKGEYLVTQRAGWPLSYIAIENPEMIKKHLKKLLLNVQKPDLHNAVIRNTVRLLQFVEIPKSIQGLATEVCFRFLNDIKQPVAIRCFSMTVLANLSKVYPELKNELKISMEENIHYSTAGFKAQVKKVMKEIE